MTAEATHELLEHARHGVFILRGLVGVGVYAWRGGAGAEEGADVGFGGGGGVVGWRVARCGSKGGGVVVGRVGEGGGRWQRWVVSLVISHALGRWSRDTGFGRPAGDLGDSVEAG